ncbi:MAG: signal peptidase I [Lachnospiraceae bacterium]|nr:signal peptidase I [Lachnospiraceae bacterium]
MIEEFQDDLKLEEEFQDTTQDSKVVAKKKKKKELFGFVIYVVFVFAFAYLIVTFVGQRTVVIGHSMENTLANGDNLIVDKISYRFKDPKRFDIIVFPYEFKEDTYYIKRIIGLPGETVLISSEGVIYINGKELNESYGREVIRNAGAAGAPIELKEGEYFVLGDNRNNSEDSRFSDVGIIHKNRIVGKAVFRIYPFDSIGTLK